MKPAFLFIGPSKSGSSWFFEVLREHPSVFVPHEKGTFFFDRFHHRGSGWYEGCFADAEAGQVVGEVCHDYLSDPQALARIRAYRKDMRLICCLRHPYERAVSSWKFYQRNGLDRPTLAEQGQEMPSVFEEGYYATHLANVFAAFPRDQVLIFFFGEIAAYPETVARRLYEFIGVDGSFVPASLLKRVNPAAAPRSRILARFVARMDAYARQLGLSGVVARLKRIRWLRSAVRRALYRDSVDAQGWSGHLAEFPSHVVQRYEQEIGELEQILGQDLSRWRAPPKAGARVSAAPQTTTQA
ncbi:MAG: sulfotransferase domain-containing protein [Nevskia sp.]|nr:sulfotransferase domain-containing protein [Nevskia sp.]